jgi:competence protein ComEA
MNTKMVRHALALAIGFGFATWSSAQDGSAAAKTNPTPKVSPDTQIQTQAKQRAAKAKAKAAELAKAVDLNHASKADLKKLRGITDAYAEAIMARRPYKSKADLVVKNAIPLDLYQTLRKQVAVK